MLGDSWYPQYRLRPTLLVDPRVNSLAEQTMQSVDTDRKTRYSPSATFNVHRGKGQWLSRLVRPCTERDSSKHMSHQIVCIFDPTS
jgi:hypothetical protein